MKSFPMFIRTTNRTVVICGGGEQAAQKARLMLKTDAQLLIAATDPEPELAELIASGRARLHDGPITPDLFAGAAMGFIATGSPAADSCLHVLAKVARCAVNVVDRPDLCDLTTPSIVDRDPLVVAIGTDGTAPVLARQVKTRVEQMLPANIGGLAAFAGRLRNSVAAKVPQAGRRGFWRWVFAEGPAAAWARGAEREAASLIKSAIAAGGAPDEPDTGRISLVGAGPGARDLLTLRAVQRLQEADVIFYDRLSGDDVLELARRDARRVYVGKSVGEQAWPQDRISRLIVAEALQGQRVVRLKSGDPGIFGRATEELEAARQAGIPVDIVPGITAASAAAASAGHSLTERGATDALVLTTGMCRQGDPLPDPVQRITPGTTGAFYMAARQVRRIQSGLMAQGLPASSPCTLVVDASKPSEHIWNGPLEDLARHMSDNGIDGSAMILVSWPKPATQARAMPPAVLARSA